LATTARYCKTRFSGNGHGRRGTARLNARERGMSCVGMAIVMNCEGGERVERGRENESG